MGKLRDPWQLGCVAVMSNQIHGIPCQVAHRMASEAVGGRAACLVDNDGGSASSRSEAGPNGNGPCRIRSPLTADTCIPGSRTECTVVRRCTVVRS